MLLTMSYFSVHCCCQWNNDADNDQKGSADNAKVQKISEFDAEDSESSVYITVAKETIVIMFTRVKKTFLLTKFKRVLRVMLVKKSDFSIQEHCCQSSK